MRTTLMSSVSSKARAPAKIESNIASEIQLYLSGRASSIMPTPSRDAIMHPSAIRHKLTKFIPYRPAGIKHDLQRLASIRSRLRGVAASFSTLLEQSQHHHVVVFQSKMSRAFIAAGPIPTRHPTQQGHHGSPRRRNAMFFEDPPFHPLSEDLPEKKLIAIAPLENLSISRHVNHSAIGH